jgi:GT2 family glycosyltransferase
VERFGEDCSPLVNFLGGDAEYLPRFYGANAAYRRQLLVDAGGWNEELLLAEDVELSWRFQSSSGTALTHRLGAVVFHHHRSSLRSLARQFWMYGLGEALIDTLFRNAPNYPRPLNFYTGRLASQLGAMVRCLPWGGIRVWLLLRGKATLYEAAVPWLWMLIEASNIVGKLQGLLMTCGLRDSKRLQARLQRWVPRGYKPARPQLAPSSGY